MICLQTLPEHLLYHSISLLYHSSGSSPMEGATVLCLNAISRRTVNICHLRIYISCYYLLGLGPRGVSLGVLDFRQHELSVEEGSSRNHGAAWRCFSSGCPIYQHPKWFQFCSTQRNEEYLMTSIFIRRSVTPVSFLCIYCSSKPAMRINLTG